jgi:hypothetical protein
MFQRLQWKNRGYSFQQPSFNNLRHGAGLAFFSTSAETAGAHERQKLSKFAPKAPSFQEVPYYKPIRETVPDPQAQAAAKLRDAFKGRNVNKMPYSRCHGALDLQEMDGFCAAGTLIQ